MSGRYALGGVRRPHRHASRQAPVRLSDDQRTGAVVGTIGLALSMVLALVVVVTRL